MSSPNENPLVIENGSVIYCWVVNVQRMDVKENEEEWPVGIYTTTTRAEAVAMMINRDRNSPWLARIERKPVDQEPEMPDLKEIEDAESYNYEL